ncbi:acyl-CoA dehydrogenase family protein [Corynebacterium halotolerans]|uniref:Acyl-CoA dehydrogenase type 2 domain-containing protein n=1 Tax=Corynebacterium halotolerans YIM 70093 = DSM 44683 TaxID=1121362 RepID=M1NIA7_9CORY|nr:acyl-CoA dehydrogenase family protein [Corynebacterium halotolerans]AGF71143.1 acyl-CoA dehydrogenase type 2 domain-containing protein [Corynebacterium halotolerans YIM 70093 = DSM 44683]
MTTAIKTNTYEDVRLNEGAEFAALMDRIETFIPLIKENAEKNEEIGKLTDETVAALHEVGAFRIGVPEALGGYELTPRQTIQVLEKVSYADPSTGWVLMALQMITGTTGAYLPPEAQDELFADGNYPLIAGQGTRSGKAMRVEGGYRVSGRWSFGSGMLHATHVHSAAYDAENDRPIVVTFPKDQAELYFNWDVMGLRATGSIDYSCEDLFVPDTYVYEPTTTAPLAGGALYRLGLANMSGICHTGWALGVGRRLLDEMKDLAQKKHGSSGTSVDTDHFHAEYARAEARMRSARAWVMDVWADNEATLDAGELLSMEQETLTRLMLNNTTWAVHEVGEIVHYWSATAMARRGDLQRLFRDLNVGTGHVTSGPVVLQACGKYLAGLAPGAFWAFIKLIEPDKETGK